MVVVDLDMSNITKTPHVHNTLLALIIIQPHLVFHINLTLVLANAPSAITIPLLDAINHHTALLLNHVPIAIEVDLTLTQGVIQIPNINKLSNLLNNQFAIIITLAQQNLNLKQICIIQIPPHVKDEIIKLTLSLVLLGSSTCTIVNNLKKLLHLQN